MAPLGHRMVSSSTRVAEPRPSVGPTLVEELNPPPARTSRIRFTLPIR